MYIKFWLMKSLWAGLQAPSPPPRFLNDGIDPQDFCLQYIKVDQVIRMVSRYGPGALMAKFDVESAYRNIPVHPDDRLLLGMRGVVSSTLTSRSPLVSVLHHLFSIP